MFDGFCLLLFVLSGATVLSIEGAELESAGLDCAIANWIPSNSSGAAKNEEVVSLVMFHHGIRKI